MNPDPSHETLRCHRAVLRQLDELVELIDDAETLGRSAAGISGWSIGEQVEHLLITGERVVAGLHKALDGDGPTEGELTPGGEHVLARGKIPRGKGEAPPGAHPRGRDGDAVRDGLVALREDLAGFGNRLASLEESRVRWRHPYFGHLRPAEWLRFLEIHNQHHQSIIDDIRRAG